MKKENFLIWPYVLQSASGQFTQSSLPIGSMSAVEREHIDRAVRAYKSGTTVEFVEHLHKNQWAYFDEQTKGISGRVELWAPLPDGWPVDDKKHLIICNKWLLQNVNELLAKRKQFQFQYNRKAKDLTKHFLMTYGTTREHERELITQAIERLNVFDQSLYSRPKLDPANQENLNIDYVFPIRNDHAIYRNIEGTNTEVSKKYLREQSNILPVLHKASKTIHCWVVLDSFPFVKDLSPAGSEKLLWPIFFGVPFIYIGSPNMIDLIKEWGFQPNDSFRYDVRGCVEQMMWLKSIFDDPELAQKWQDAQGELINKNRKALEDLPEKLLPVERYT